MTTTKPQKVEFVRTPMEEDSIATVGGTAPNSPHVHQELPVQDPTGQPRFSPMAAEDLPAGLHEAFLKDSTHTNFKLHHTQSHRLIASLLAKRFIVLSGIAGSGKTKLAQAFAHWITPTTVSRDPFSPGSEIASGRITYYVKNSDTLAVEFWNSSIESDATKVTLPREMIREWADYIRGNEISQQTTARQIREVVTTTSKFSAQLHSFETHLKAAAFALIGTENEQIPEKCCELLPVGADWTSNENVLGYPDGLDGTRYVTRPALDLILRAINHQETPYFLILDEMNLSHVERYFADILSAVESDEEIPLYEAGKDAFGNKMLRNGVPERLKLPDNLFIIGTVNIDETTYMFSPKVLDRANVMEFLMEPAELEAFLREPKVPSLEKLAGRGQQFGMAFVAAAADKKIGVPASIKFKYETEMLLFFNLLRQYNAEFGYRVSYETARFLYFYNLLGGYSENHNDWFSGAMDAVIVQKFLPKLHGSRSKLEGLFWALAWACGAERGAVPDGLSVDQEKAKTKDLHNAFLIECLAAGKAEDEGRFGPLKTWENLRAKNSSEPAKAARYPLSYDKVMRMWRMLVRDQFVTFAEA